MSRPPEEMGSEAARELGLSMGLLPEEYASIEQALGRVPTRTELTVFAGMWSEHCSYKSTLRWLRTLPTGTNDPNILAGPGAHAGVVRVSEEWAVAFKVESHNHPSAVEPYQGAATGVGGILRDIIAQGARPCAIMDSLCFGSKETRRTQHLADGVVEGIAGYGNAFGVPNLGGRTVFDARYDGNPLVNALAAGLVRPAEMRSGAARGVGNAVLYVGASTGRDGILGAAFASEELADDTTEDRPHVQVGDPFTGKKLMEACMSFTEEQGLVACQDMGACGITCAAFEMAAAGKVGVEIDLETVPLREAGMSPQEIMLSESQERFLFIVASGKEGVALEHFRSYGVHAVVCGRVTEGNHGRALYDGELVVDLPAPMVADGTPPSDWPLADRLPAVPPYPEFAAAANLGDTLRALLRDPCIANKAAVYEHYDQTVGNRTVRAPDQAEAGVLGLPGTRRGFALTMVSRGDICAVDPYHGVQAVLAEASRNLACVGARLVAVTDGLNVASPRDPIENRKLSETIRGLKAGLEALEIPVTGGNCSLYNESAQGPIPPTPMVGALGIVRDVGRVPVAAPSEDDLLFLLGTVRPNRAVSRYGRLMTNGKGGDPPAVDLAAERRLAKLLVEQCEKGAIRAAKDVAAGGLAVALAKLCLHGGVGAQVRLTPRASSVDWLLFGEYPAMAWVAVPAADAPFFEAAAVAAGMPICGMGWAGGDHLAIHDYLEVNLEALGAAYWRGEGTT